MADNDTQRKLKAIFSADVKGYSKLMGDDEEATVRTLKSYRSAINDLAEQYRGRIVDSPGDNILAEFNSVVDAVNCAVEIQRELAERNAELADNRKMVFRIGVNLGDVIEEEGRIYGDGVNIAARVESLAEPGGICISGRAYDQVENKLGLKYENLGEHQVKNIARPIRVYRVLSYPGAAAHRVVKAKATLAIKWRKAILSIIAVVAVAVAGAVAWHKYLKPTTLEKASIEKMAFPLPDKPSIAVLPFANVGADPDQDYFSDGITDDLITDLSKVSGLFVIARNSVFTYKGKPVKVQQVAEELGVRYVLEGSVRRGGDKLRVNAQLIDATTGHHLWADRYDGRIDDVFALQDKIRQKIIAALAVKLTIGEKETVDRKHTDSIAAYDRFLQGRAHYLRRTPEDFAKAVRYFKEAVELDPDYSRAYAMLALTYWESHHNFWNQSLGVPWYGARIRAQTYLQKAMKNPSALVYQVESRILIGLHEHEEALNSAERAITMDPNDADSYLNMAYALIHAGRPEESFDFINTAIRINPNYPAYYLFVLGLAHFNMDQFEAAANAFERALQRNPVNYVPLIYLTAAYAYLDRKQEAAAAIQKLNESLPVVSVDFESHPVMAGRYKRAADRDRLIDGFRKAGLPETPYDILRQLGND